MERSPAYRAGVGLLGPGADAGIVNNVLTAVEGSDYIEIAIFVLDGFVLEGSGDGIVRGSAVNASGRG